MLDERSEGADSSTEACHVIANSSLVQGKCEGGGDGF